MEKMRRAGRGLLPPPTYEYAAKPVNVSVRTVVVTSATRSCRTVAFLSPIDNAVKTIIAYS